MITETEKTFLEIYSLALRNFLNKGEGETSLKNAYMLGRQALEEQNSILDIVVAHHRAIANLIEASDGNRDLIKLSADFLSECLSPFEMAQRGFQESIAALNSLNARLEDEVAKRTQDLRKSEELYRTLIDLSPDAITMTDLQGNITFCNRQTAMLHGYLTPSQTVGINAGDFVPHEDMPHVRKLALHILNEGGIGNLEFTLTRKDGMQIPVEVKVTLMRDGDGNPTGFIGMIRDITERKLAQSKLESLFKAEAQARQKAEKDNELRLKMLAIVSHELRTPLTSIKGFADTLLATDVVWDAEHQHDFIQTIEEEAEKLGDLIEQMLDLSKMDAGVFHLSPVSQSPDSLIAAAIPHLQALTGGYHHLVVSIPDSFPNVFADAQRVGQVLENLVENATKYAPVGTEIKISVKVNGKFLEISVADEGPGIPRDEITKVFQAFYRMSENAGNSKGAGLGLTICRKLIEAQGGQIWIDDHPGPGAIVRFTLPLIDAGEAENKTR